jgi:hypothetical protein
VIRQDWPAMGRRRVSSVPTYWGARIRGAGVRLVRADERSAAGPNLVARDGERAAARQHRLGEARATGPPALSWLMLATVVIVLAVLAAATLNAVDARVHVALVVTAATAFTATLLLTHDLDQPYSGAVRRAPMQTEFVRDQIAAEVHGSLPCTGNGRPRNAPGFHATTATLG